MRWLMFISKKEMNLKKAFEVSDYIDITQRVVFNVNDLVYIFVENGDRIKLNYVCRVDKINIDDEDELYFYDNLVTDPGIELVGYFSRLSLIGKLKEPIDFDDIKTEDLSEVPLDPKQEIGNNRHTFIKIDDLIGELDKDDQSFEIRSEQTQYVQNREELLTILTVSDWYNLSDEEFVEVNHLMKNELSEHLSMDEYMFIQYNQDKNYYFSKYGKIVDKSEYIKTLKEEIGAFFTNKKETPLLDQFPYGKLMLSCLYNDHTAFVDENLKEVRSKLNVSTDDIIESNKLITNKVREINKELNDANAYRIFSYLTEKFNLSNTTTKEIEKNDNGIFLSDSFVSISSRDKKTIERLLMDYKKVLVTNTQIIDTQKDLRSVLKDLVLNDNNIIYDPSMVSKLDSYVYHGMLLDLETLDYLKLKKLNEYFYDSNIYVIMYNHGKEIENQTIKNRILYSKFYQYTISANTSSELSDFLSNKGMNQDVIKNVLSNITDINEKIISNNQENLISLDLFIGFNGTKQSWIDIIDYKCNPVIVQNKLSDIDTNYCNNLLHEIKNIVS